MVVPATSNLLKSTRRDVTSLSVSLSEQSPRVGPKHLLHFAGSRLTSRRCIEFCSQGLLTPSPTRCVADPTSASQVSVQILLPVRFSRFQLVEKWLDPFCFPLQLARCWQVRFFGGPRRQGDKIQMQSTFAPLVPQCLSVLASPHYRKWHCFVGARYPMVPYGVKRSSAYRVSARVPRGCLKGAGHVSLAGIQESGSQGC